MTDHFYHDKEEPVRGCLLALRKMILSHDDTLNETKKYGMPCFCLGKRPLCYLWTHKHTGLPYILFVDGLLIDHPALEQGSRAKMKIFNVDPTSDLPVQLIDELLGMAIDVRKSQ